MRHHTTTRRVGRLAAVAAVGAAALIGLAPSAFADTANATANAAQLTLVGATTGTESATNPGGQPTDVETATPALSILGTQTAITAGALQQTAVATGTGTSSACAGLLGTGASIQVGTQGICGLTTGQSGGVTIGGPLGVGVIDANAIVATCSDSSTGTLTGSAQLVNATALGGALALPLNPGANTSLLGLIFLNTQSVTNGVITVTALSIPAIGLKIGTVTCGPNAVTSPTSLFPLKSLPIAGGTAAVLVAGGLLWYRRRGRHLADA